MSAFAGVGFQDLPNAKDDEIKNIGVASIYPLECPKSSVSLKEARQRKGSNPIGSCYSFILSASRSLPGLGSDAASRSPVRPARPPVSCAMDIFLYCTSFLYFLHFWVNQGPGTIVRSLGSLWSSVVSQSCSWLM